MIPGMNLLGLALQVIQPQTVQHYAVTARTVNAAGLYVNTYADPVGILGSFQPVPRESYQHMGLDYTKEYVLFYSATPILDIDRDHSSDQLEFAGERYQVESKNNWRPVDGWAGVLCVKVPTP